MFRIEMVLGLWLEDVARAPLFREKGLQPEQTNLCGLISEASTAISGKRISVRLLNKRVTDLVS